MLQRQILFKQLQELQRRQQLQELGDARNQDYINQLLLLKQTSGFHFAPIVDGAPVHDSQMIQHGGSSVFQGSSNGLVLAQSHNHALGPMALSLPQCDMSLYGNAASNADRSLNQHSSLQGQYNHSANLLFMSGDDVPGMSSMHPSGNDGSTMSHHQDNYFSEQIGMPGDSLLTNQVLQERNSFGQVPVHSLNRDLLPVNYTQQGIFSQRSTLFLESGERYGDSGSYGTPPGQLSKASQHQGSLDPLEQKILYNTDDNSWTSSFGSRKIGTPSFESTVENPPYVDNSPSIQSGSWSALMQSAVAETSSSDTAIQEEWSGLSSQNPEPSACNQPLNFINSEIPQNNWIDRSIQHVSSPCSDPEPSFQKSNKNYGFPDFKQPGVQILKQSDDFHSEFSHVSSRYSPRNSNNLVQTSLPSPNTWPGQCHDLRGPTWLHGNTSDSGDGYVQKSFNHGNQMSVQRSSIESATMALGDNVEPSSAFFSPPSDVRGKNFTAQRLEQLNKNDISNDHAAEIQLNSKVSSLNELPLADASAEYFAEPCDNHPVSQGFGFKLGPTYAGDPQSHSFFPSFSMGSSCMTSLPSDYYVNYTINQHQAPPVLKQLATKFPDYCSASSQAIFQQRGTSASGPEFPLVETVATPQSSGTSDVLQSVPFLTGLPTSSSNNITHGDVGSPKPYKFSSDMFHSPDTVSGKLENSSGVPNAQPNQNHLKQEHSVQEFGTYPGASRYYEQQLEKASPILESVHHTQSPVSMSRVSRTVEFSRNHSEADGVVSGSLMACTFRDKAKYGRVGVQLRTSPGDIKGQNFSQEAQNIQSGKIVSPPPQDFPLMEKFSQNGTQTHSTGNTEISNKESQSRMSLQMAPSWFKHYGTMKNGLALPTNNPKTATNSAQPFPGLSIGSLQGHNLIMQLNSADANQGSGLWQSSSASLMSNKNLPLPTNVADQDSNVVKSKKRKLVDVDMIPWHREVNSDGANKLHSISTAEVEWAQVLNRRQEEVKNYAEIVDDAPPMVRTKRRLTFTTQLMQQVFRPAHTSSLSTDASSKYNVLAYSAARLELGDACCLLSKPIASPDDVSLDKLSTFKRSACNFSKVVEDLISRVKKLEGDLSRLDKSLSVLDVKVENQDLEKFSTINRFAKYHIRAHPATVDPTNHPSLQKAIPERYISALPMPRTIPEVVDCLSL